MLAKQEEWAPVGEPLVCSKLKQEVFRSNTGQVPYCKPGSAWDSTYSMELRDLYYKGTTCISFTLNTTFEILSAY